MVCIISTRPSPSNVRRCGRAGHDALRTSRWGGGTVRSKVRELVNVDKALQADVPVIKRYSGGGTVRAFSLSSSQLG